MAFHLIFRSGKIAVHTWRYALLIAISYTLVSHRYDPDDALYLFFGLLPLDQPMQAINLFPFYDTARMLVSYPTIEAVVSYWTGISFLQVYYLVCACPGGHAGRTCLLRAVSAARR